MFSLQRLLGQEDKFFGLLEASAQEAQSSIQALAHFWQNPDKVKTLDEFIVARRREKAITNQISDALCTTFVTALEREDIESLSLSLYKIPKTTEKVAERILLAPHLAANIDLSRHIAMIGKASETVLTMIRELRKGVHLERTRRLNEELQAIEGEMDNMLLVVLRDLYNGKYPETQVLFLKDLIELLEKVTDRCRDAGNVITHIVLKNS
jgi:uncharacterized protein Yka (UPF0111/DUF47 family)